MTSALEGGGGVMKKQTNANESKGEGAQANSDVHFSDYLDIYIFHTI